MDWYRIVELVKWPFVVLVLAVVFREPLKALISRLSRIRYKDVDVIFQKALERAHQEADRVSLPEEVSDYDPTVDVESPAIPRGTDYLLKMAKDFPAGAVIEAWQGLESAMRETYRTADLDYVLGRPASSISVKELIETLRTSHPDSSVFPIVDELFALRNQIAHARGVDLAPGTARKYVKLAERVGSELWKIVGC